MNIPFDDIRPYTDEELPAALQRIAAWDLFPQVIRFIYPTVDVTAKKEEILQIKSVHELQATLMNDAIKRIIATTTQGFTYSGLNHLRRGVPYLFVSNHRDITLDAFLLQHLLLEQRGCTSHIVFGQNLLALPVMEDLFRCNKLIGMPRGGSPRQFYESLHHLSDYLHHLVVEQHQSVWIAQRNGRAKDGRDLTAPAVIKMLCLGGDGSPLQRLAELNLVPMSISYEWDPCDAMKANELFLSRSGSYQKAPGEDIKSVVTGIIGNKGRVHLSIGAPLTLRDLTPPAGADLSEHVASLLDQRIHNLFKPMPTHYAASHLLGQRSFPGRYTQHTLNGLQARLNALPDDDRRQLLLQMYANALAN